MYKKFSKVSGIQLIRVDVAPNVFILFFQLDSAHFLLKTVSWTTAINLKIKVSYNFHQGHIIQKFYPSYVSNLHINLVISNSKQTEIKKLKHQKDSKFYSPCNSSLWDMKTVGSTDWIRTNGKRPTVPATDALTSLGSVATPQLFPEYTLLLQQSVGKSCKSATLLKTERRWATVRCGKAGKQQIQKHFRIRLPSTKQYSGSTVNEVKFKSWTVKIRPNYQKVCKNF